MVNFKFCPYCKARLVKNKNNYTCPVCKAIIYKHSAITGNVFPIKNGKVLLAKRKENPKKGKWDVVGGFLEYGEHPKVGAQREFLEETGLKETTIDFLTIEMDEYKFQGRIIKTLNVFFVGEIHGKVTPSDDISEVHWFPINTSIKLDFGYPCVKRALIKLDKRLKTETVKQNLIKGY